MTFPAAVSSARAGVRHSANWKRAGDETAKVFVNTARRDAGGDAATWRKAVHAGVAYLWGGVGRLHVTGVVIPFYYRLYFDGTSVCTAGRTGRCGAAQHIRATADGRAGQTAAAS